MKTSCWVFSTTQKSTEVVQATCKFDSEQNIVDIRTVVVNNQTRKNLPMTVMDLGEVLKEQTLRNRINESASHDYVKKP